MEDKENRSLYRFEYYEPEEMQTYIDWVWLEPHEVTDYKSSIQSVSVRKATRDEEDLYNEAYADGYGVAAILEFQSQYDGITFRVERDENDKLDMFNTTKMFQCAICDRHLDFETEVGTISAGFFVGAIRDDKLWHVCYDCGSGANEINWLEQGWMMDDDSKSAGEEDR